jgi:peroxin-5
LCPHQLGATLANSQRSEGALPAYHKALDIKPKYARAWLNMGTSAAFI